MAVYPNNTPSDADLYVALDNFGTILNGAIDAVQTTITLTSTVGLPTVGILTIESEKIKYTGVSGSDITGCTRGFSSTTPSAHSNGVTVELNVVEEHHNATKDEIIAVATDNRNSFSADLNDSTSPAATAPSLKERLDQVVTQVKNITGEADWKDTPDNTIAALETDVNNLQSGKKAIATGTNYAFETTGATGNLQETTVTASRAVVTDANGLPAASATTAAEIGYVSGVTSAIQTQLDDKANETLDNLTTTAINTSLVSDTNNTDDLGSSTIGWKDLYLEGSIKDGTVIVGTPLASGFAIRGTNTNDLAATGFVGEYLESSIGSSTNTGATGNWADATSLTLSPGHWDLSGFVYFARNGATYTSTVIQSGISLTSGNSATGLDPAKNYCIFSVGANLLTWSEYTSMVPTYNFFISSTTTFYLKISTSVFTVGQPQYRCTLSARRVR